MIRHSKGMARVVLFGLLIAAAAGCQATDSQVNEDGVIQSAKMPLNVLFIMSDQHNAHALGCYGNTEIKTPSLDRLAAAGVRFQNAFCQTGQCCPSRYTIWTGRYAHSHGLRWNHVIEPLNEITIGEVFRDAGYVTATIGKHNMQYDVALHGFDQAVEVPDYNRFVEGLGVPHCWAEGDWLPYRNDQFARPIGTSHADNEHHMAGFFGTEAVKFLQANQNKPFCLWLSFHGPHVPHVASKQWMDLYDADALTLPPNFYEQRSDVPAGLNRLRQLLGDLTEQDFKKVLRCYYALVSQIDHNIGRVLDELDRLGLTERTIIVYTADHGEMMGEHRACRKAVLNYDATVRVPMIIRMPGGRQRGVVIDELVGLVDLMPTLCEMAGLNFPKKVKGSSLVPLLEGRKTEWREVIFSEIGYPQHAFPPGMCTMARTKEHKYVHHDNAGKPMEESFDLRSDPWETVNQAANPEYAEALATLRKALKQWNENTDHAPLYLIEKEFRQHRKP